MGLIRNAAGRAVGSLGKRVAPEVSGGFVRSVAERAIDGVGPLLGAARSADRALGEADGDAEAAIRDLIDGHVKLAGAQGFATNLGGIVTAVLAIPANVTGLALIQCHLVAGIAHLRGHRLAAPGVRNAVLTCLLGASVVDSLVRSGDLPGRPADLVARTTADPQLDERIARAVTAELLAGVGGKRMATMIGRRIPLVGGAIGGATDGYGTWQIGRFAATELSHPAAGPEVIDSPA